MDGLAMSSMGVWFVASCSTLSGCAKAAGCGSAEKSIELTHGLCKGHRELGELKYLEEVHHHSAAGSTYI